MRARSLLPLLLLLLTAIAALPARGLVLPEIPASLRILTEQEVKNYWINQLPQPAEPSRLARDYQSLIVSYHREVGERHRLIQAIRAGKYDRRAKIVMLRHNQLAYRKKGDTDQVLALGEQLAKLEAIEAQQAAEFAQADRLERLIAATERLAAAIEKNGGVVPDNADEIIPFERDRDDRRDVVTYLYDEIAICNSYPYRYYPYSSRYRYHSHRRHPHQVHRSQVVPATPRSVRTPTVRRTPSVIPSQPRVRQPQIPQAR